MLVSVFIRSKPFRKKNKQAWNCLDNLIILYYSLTGLWIVNLFEIWHKLFSSRIHIHLVRISEKLNEIHKQNLRWNLQWILHHHEEMTSHSVLWLYSNFKNQSHRFMNIFRSFKNQSHRTIFRNFINQGVTNHYKIKTLRCFGLRSTALESKTQHIKKKKKKMDKRRTKN